MASTSTPASMDDASLQFHSLSQTTTSVVDIDDYLEGKNLQFVASLVPTLAYLAVLMVCGLVGNTLVFVVYYRRFKPSVTRTYILAMSVCDLMTNLLSLPADIVEVRFFNTFDQRWLCKSFRTVKSFLGFLSAFILVAVAVDRQRAICNPYSNPTTVRHAVIVLVINSVCAVVFTAPYSVLTGARTVQYRHTNITGLECSIDDVFVKSLFLFIYNIITGLVFITCIVLMLGSYGRVARQLCLHRKNTATVMGSAVDRNKRKASNMSSHTSNFEDSSSQRTHSSSAHSQPSAKSKCSLPGADIELSVRNAQEDVTSGLRADTVLAHTEDPNKSSSDSKDLADNTLSQTMKPCARTSDQDAHVNDTNNRNFGTGGDPTHATDIALSGIKRQVDDKHISDAKEGRQMSSRSVLSRIRRTTSDAKAILNRKKSTPKPRGSVKKIPTRTTFMMFVLTVVFIINYLPYLVLVSVRARTHVDLAEVLGLNVYCIGLRSYFVNSAINPLVYSFCSDRFRQECRRVLRCKRN